MNKSLVKVLHVPSLCLAALLQLLPVARAALPVTQGAANIMAIIFRWAVGSTAVLGSVQAMSGGSVRITNPGHLTATNGQSFSLLLRTVPRQWGYWEVTNPPPGLALIASPWRLEGVPSSNGFYKIGLVAKANALSGPTRTERDTMSITVVSPSPTVPQVFTPPVAATATAGLDAPSVISVFAHAGFAPISYRWRRDGMELPGQTNAALSLLDVTTNDAGQYDVVLSNHLGTITSSTAALTVRTLPVFVTGAGAFNGLFLDSNNVRHASSGFFTALLQTNGAFKGSLQSGKSKFPLTGAFDADGHFTNQIKRLGAAPLVVELHLAVPGGQSILGRVTDGVWQADLDARRTPFHARTNPATALAGRYTLLIPGSTNGAVAPQGDGAGAATITTAGLVALTGALADGSPLVQRVSLSGRGEWPCYVPLYAGRGALFGWLRVRPDGEFNLTGNLHWLRPAGPLPKIYTNGFALESPAVGARYTPTNGPTFDTNFAWVIFSGGNLETPSANPVNLLPASRVTNAGTNALVLTVTPATGLFKGTVKLPEFSKPLRYSGAVLRGPAFGGGAFTDTNKIGHVHFGP